ncbi:MAG: DUF4276 family protein [Polyangiaceae bacterium]|nr:DUF4276 family protein [Polyangiaceae bacterium]
MTVEHVEILVEELSMEALLRQLLPRVVGQLSHQIYPYRGKADLLGKLPARLRAYARFLPDTWRIVVVLDRDDDDCVALKQELDELAKKAGLTVRASAGASDFQLVNRLAVEELEAWYFGDWDAVRAAYPRVDPNVPPQRKYRDPDAITGGTWEAFERVLRRAGYFKAGLNKIEAARAIGAHMNAGGNSSASFQKLHEALTGML